MKPKREPYIKLPVFLSFWNKNKTLILGSVVCCFLTFGCQKNEYEKRDEYTGFEYMPLKLGNSWTYKLDSTIYKTFNNQNNQVTTSSYLIKDEIANVYANLGSKDSLFEVVRSLWDSATRQWQIQSSYTLQIRDFKLIKTDSSQKEYKLKFPLALYEFWDGNLFNQKEEQHYEIQYLNQFMLTDSFEFDSTTKIIQQNLENSLLKDYAEEIFAKNIGMVSKTTEKWTKDNSNQVIPNGYLLQYTLIDYEIE